MTGRQSSATEAALADVRAGSSVMGAARKHGLAPSTVRRALRRAGVPPLTGVAQPPAEVKIWQYVAVNKRPGPGWELVASRVVQNGEAGWEFTVWKNKIGRLGWELIYTAPMPAPETGETDA